MNENMPEGFWRVFISIPAFVALVAPPQELSVNLNQRTGLKRHLCTM